MNQKKKTGLFAERRQNQKSLAKEKQKPTVLIKKKKLFCILNPGSQTKPNVKFLLNARLIINSLH